MNNKINSKLKKLSRYYNLIDNKLVFSNKSINRYKNHNTSISMSNDKQLEKLKNSIKNIRKCNLKSSANNLVFSDGNPKSSIMIVGEAPGANEDKLGKPFVGRAGQLLDKMLNSINLNRKNVYITNVVNYRPPENRKPNEKEISRYLPYLIKHIEIIKPKILFLLGSTALNTLVGDEEVISKVRGKWINKKIGNFSSLIITSFHPAFLMRQPDQKKYAWEDLKMIRKKISELKINLNV